MLSNAVVLAQSAAGDHNKYAAYSFVDVGWLTWISLVGRFASYQGTHAAGTTCRYSHFDGLSGTPGWVVDTWRLDHRTKQ